MGKIINRAKMRGKPLDKDCRKAHVTRYEYGENDNRCYCLGLYDPMYDEPCEQCIECFAFVNNEVPPKEVSE